jgi:hypothetical protein
MSFSNGPFEDDAPAKTRLCVTSPADGAAPSSILHNEERHKSAMLIGAAGHKGAVKKSPESRDGDAAIAPVVYRQA